MTNFYVLYNCNCELCISFQAFKNDGQDLLSTGYRPQLGDLKVFSYVTLLWDSQSIRIDFFRQMLSLEMIWRTTRMLHGERGKVASHQEGSGFENSPVWIGFLINQAPFLMAMSPTQNAQVLRMNSSTSTRIQQSGIYSHFEITHGPENLGLKDICCRKFYFADCSCSMNAILAGYLSCDNFAASCITC